MHARPLRTLVIVLPVLAIADCTVGPDYKRPDVAIPQEFRSQVGPSEANSLADLAWWNVFQDKALQNLITQALQNNYDLQVAIARIKQAREVVAEVKSQALPQIGYQVSAQGQTAIVAGQDSVGTTTYGVFSGLLNAAWEFDVWGRIRRETEAAQANLLGQEDVRRGVMLTLVSDLAAGYFQLIELDRELGIARESVTAYQKTYDLFNDRFQGGKDSELPVTRSRAAFESANANISTLTRQIAQQENALSILAGVPPGTIRRGRALTEQVMPQTPVSSTTELLRRRPDILQAEMTMVAANAEIGAAVANYYPTIGLSALAGGAGVGIGSDIHGFGVWAAALNAAGPLFTGGRLDAQYHQRQAFWDETVAQYKKTILNAFQETSDALVAQQTLVKERENLETQVQSLRHSIDIALLRYDAGRSSYFEVLEAEQELYPAEYELARTQQNQLVAVVNLYKALGGGWNLAPEQWVPTQTSTQANNSKQPTPGGHPGG
jgi:multidrug efflux system outer membrane protein